MICALNTILECRHFIQPSGRCWLITPLPLLSWVDAMNSYISARASVEKQIKSFSDPTCDRLLPDLRPEMISMGIKTLVGEAGVDRSSSQSCMMGGN
jgi:hypothetical protein